MAGSLRSPAARPLFWQLEELQWQGWPQQEGHNAAGFSWQGGVHLSSYFGSRFWELPYFPKSGNGKAMFSVPVWL